MCKRFGHTLVALVSGSKLEEPKSHVFHDQCLLFSELRHFCCIHQRSQDLLLALLLRSLLCSTVSPSPSTKSKTSQLVTIPSPWFTISRWLEYRTTVARKKLNNPLISEEGEKIFWNEEAVAKPSSAKTPHPSVQFTVSPLNHGFSLHESYLGTCFR